MTEYEIKCAICKKSSGIKFEKPKGEFGEFWHCEPCLTCDEPCLTCNERCEADNREDHFDTLPTERTQCENTCDGGCKFGYENEHYCEECR